MNKLSRKAVIGIIVFIGLVARSADAAAVRNILFELTYIFSFLLLLAAVVALVGFGMAAVLVIFGPPVAVATGLAKPPVTTDGVRGISAEISPSKQRIINDLDVELHRVHQTIRRRYRSENDSAIVELSQPLKSSSILGDKSAEQIIVELDAELTRLQHRLAELESKNQR